jgi:hypothetical protein
VRAQGNGEWKLTHNDPGTYTAGEEYWECTDGREILFRRPYIEDGIEIEAFYRVSDQYGEIGREYKTMKEAQAAVRPIYTPQEIVAVADELASAVWKYDPEEDEIDEILMDLARKYLSARRIKLEHKNEEDEKTKAKSEYIVTMRIKGSNLPAVEKKAKAAWGDKVKISHVRRSSSNQALLDDAKEMVEGAAEIVAELHGAMEERRDNTPENFQSTETYAMVEQCVDELESLESDIDGILPSFDEVEFPGW